MIRKSGFVACAKFLGLKPEDLAYILRSRLNEDVSPADIQSVLQGTALVPHDWWDALRGFWTDCRDIAWNLVHDHQLEPDSVFCLGEIETYPPYVRLPLCLAMLEICEGEDLSAGAGNRQAGPRPV